MPKMLISLACLALIPAIKNNYNIPVAGYDATKVKLKLTKEKENRRK